MLTRIDHVLICVLDLQHGIDAYTRLEFKVCPGGVHLGRGAERRRHKGPYQTGPGPAGPDGGVAGAERTARRASLIPQPGQ